MNISAFRTATPKSAAKSDYPTIENERLGRVADQLARDLDTLAALEGATKEAKSILREAAYPQWVEHCKHYGLVSSVVIPGRRDPEDKSEDPVRGAMVTFPNAYRSGLTPEQQAQLKSLVGEERYGQFTETRTVLSMDAANIPAEKQDAFVEGLVALCAKLGLDPSKVVSSKQGVYPTAAFADRRLLELDPAVNLAIDNVLPTPSQVKVKK